MANRIGLVIAAIIGVGVGVLGTKLYWERTALETLEQAPLSERTESFFVDLPAQGVTLTHGGRIGLQPSPPGIATFHEPNLKNSLALLVKIRNAEGTVVGFASELEVFPEPSEAVQGLENDAKWQTDWTLVIPGRGGLFLHQQEHTGAGAPMFQHVAETGTDWVGDITITTSAGPRDDGRGVIVGGWGEFENVRGSFLEIDHFTRYTVAGNLIGSIEVRLFGED